MFDYEEIDRTVRDNKLPLLKLEGQEKEVLLQRLYDTFVIGNPRALWLSFKYVPEWIDCNMEDPYRHLPDISLSITGIRISWFSKAACPTSTLLSAIATASMNFIS